MRYSKLAGGAMCALALVSLLSLAGCGGGGGGGGGGDGVVAGSFSQTIGPAGGTIVADSGPLDGVVFVVPAGAVAQDTTFTMLPGADLATQIGDLLVGPSVQILPAGLDFNGGPVTLELPFDLDKFPPAQGIDRLEVLHRDDLGEVTRLPVMDYPAGKDSVLVEVPSLSTFQPSLPPFDVGGPWQFVVPDAELTQNPAPTNDDLDVGSADVIQDFESGEVSITPLGVLDANDVQVVFTGTFLGNRMSVSATYVGDEGQVTETISLAFQSNSVGYGKITETLLGGQPSESPISLFRTINLDAPTYSTSSGTLWDLAIEGGEPSDDLKPGSGLASSNKTASIFQLPVSPESGLTAVVMFLSDDTANPFVGTVSGDFYVFSRQTVLEGGTLVETLAFTRFSDTEFGSGVDVTPGFSWWWNEGSIDNPPTDPAAGNYGAGSANMIDD